MRINKYLAGCGLGSRRKTEDLITSGKVFVNGQKVTDLSFIVDEFSDTVVCSGEPAELINRKYYLMLNKPAGYVTTTNDDKGRPTVMDLIPEKFRRAGIFPVGRLDMDTEGLLLLTNDGELSNKLCSPACHVKKTYFVELDKPLDDIDRKKIEAGIFLHQLKLKTRRAKILSHPLAKNHIKMTIEEGKKRQIRYSFKLFGYNVLRLRRIAYGPLSVKGTDRGQVRELYENEIRRLRASLKKPDKGSLSADNYGNNTSGNGHSV